MFGRTTIMTRAHPHQGDTGARSVRVAGFSLSWEFVIQLAVLLVTVTIAWSNLNTRTTVNERDIKAMERVQERVESATNQKFEKIDTKLDALLGIVTNANVAAPRNNTTR
jgi:glycine cleavage system regulatory protein